VGTAGKGEEGTCISAFKATVPIMFEVKPTNLSLQLSLPSALASATCGVVRVRYL